MLQPARDQNEIFAVALTLTARRLRLLANGYAPLPIEGKRPPLKNWQKRTAANAAEIELWEKVYPYATNTGILTQLTPTLDIDITNPEAAEAVEALARERFEERGFVLVRTGQAPKRAILLRTDTLFRKITANVIAPSGDTDQKIELLADGQQVVVFGTHPKTGKPYSWFGGDPSSIKHEELPYVTEDGAKQFVADAVALLVKDFGYKMPPAHPTEAGKINGHDPTNWGLLVDNVVQSRQLHDSLRDLAGKLIASGMGDGAVVNVLRALMDSSNAPHDERWRARYDDIPRAVATAREKIGNPRQPSLPSRLLQSSAQFTGSFVPPDPLISGILQRRFIYALTGHTGRGKTAIALLFAANVALGRRLGDLDVEKGRVLVLAGENPTDAKMRWIALSQQMQFDRNEIDVHWIEGVFKISDAFEQCPEDSRPAVSKTVTGTVTSVFTTARKEGPRCGFAVRPGLPSSWRHTKQLKAPWCRPRPRASRRALGDGCASATSRNARNTNGLTLGLSTSVGKSSKRLLMNQSRQARPSSFGISRFPE